MSVSYSDFVNYADKGLIVIVIFGVFWTIFMYVRVYLSRKFAEESFRLTIVFSFVALAIILYLVSLILHSAQLLEHKNGFVSKNSYLILKTSSMLLFIVSGSFCLYYVKVKFLFSTATKFLLFMILWSPTFIFVLYSEGIGRFLANLSSYQFILTNKAEIDHDSVIDSVVQFLFFFTLVLVHFQFFFETLKLWHEQAKNDRLGKDFHPGSIDIFLLFLSISFSLILGLIMSGANPISVSIFSGVLAAGFSIAFRELLNNVVAGVILYLDNSLRKDHVIELADGWIGKVKQFTLRYTQLEDREKIEALIPNGRLINERILNYSRESRLVRLKVEVPLPINTDFDKISKELEKAALQCDRVFKGTSNPPKFFHIGYSNWAARTEL